MKLPFADLLRKTKAGVTPAPKAKSVAPMPTAKKSESEKLAKTVLPNVARGVAAEPAEPAGASPSGSASSTVVDTPPVSMAAETSRAPAPAKISMAPVPHEPAPHLPPAVALALEPNIERAISLPLEDVIAQMPQGYLKPRENLDVNRRVLLKAADVERGMATGRPAIPVATLFQQAPDIFMHTVPSSDGAMVALPFERVMNALSHLAVRSDQAAEQAVPQVETPFLQVTMEDTERFGTAVASRGTRPAVPHEAAEAPSVRIEPATAEAFAAAVPEATETFVPPPPERPGDEPAPNSQNQRAPIRVAFEPAAGPLVSEPARSEKFGTGESAFQRVPASSGPPVPSSAPAAPVRIPFSFPAPSDEVWKHAQAADEKTKAADRGSAKPTAKPELHSATHSAATLSAAEDGGSDNSAYEVAGSAHEPVLTLALRPILQHLPPMQLGGDPGLVRNEATVSFPMSTIVPQLASGKVTVKPNAFYAALPPEYRKLFFPNAVNAPVQLPLADVLANLPGETLNIRHDQEVHTPGEVFETPFAAKAAEDAGRLGGNQKAKTLKAEKLKPETPKAEDRTATPSAGPSTTGQVKRPPGSAAPKFHAKEAVAKACTLSGVKSCSVIFADGLSLAGNIPESMHVDGLSAVAPTLLQKLENHMLQTSLGALRGMTVHGENASLSFFSAGNVCLTALHGEEELGAESRGELARLIEELSRAYPKMETPHVDH